MSIGLKFIFDSIDKMQLNVNSTNLTVQFLWRSLVSQNVLPPCTCSHFSFETGIAISGLVVGFQSYVHSADCQEYTLRLVFLATSSWGSKAFLQICCTESSTFRITRLEVSVQIDPPCSLAADMLYWELSFLDQDMWATGAKFSFIQPQCNQFVPVALFFGSF